MPKCKDRSGFSKSMINEKLIMICDWKWVPADYESDHKFVVIEEGVDVGEGILNDIEVARIRRCYEFLPSHSEATPMLICEEVL